MRIGQIEINQDAIINEYERCSTNAYVVFERTNDCKVEGIVLAMYKDDVEFGELEDEFPFPEYYIRSADVNTDLISGKQTIDIYLS